MTTTTPTARDQYFIDVFTTALEGGIGYWSQCTDYHWSNDDGTDDYNGFYATIVVPVSDLSVDLANGATPTTYVTWDGVQEAAYGFRIDRKVIARGWKLGATLPEQGNYYWQCSNGRPPLVITDDTEWDYDACDADAIVQYGLFGKVVFG